MHRKPEPKAAAQLLCQAFAAQGVTLKHQAALNLLATLEGYESFAHMKAAQVAVQVSTTVDPVEKTFRVAYLFTQEDVSAYYQAEGDEDAKAEALAEAKEFFFATEAEMYAFMDGIDEATGSLETLNVTDDTA